MPVIEKYSYAPELAPRLCQHSSPADKNARHNAEVILHEGKDERFLCEKCAALELSSNHVLLAKAVIDLYLQHS